MFRIQISRNIQLYHQIFHKKVITLSQCSLTSVFNKSSKSFKFHSLSRIRLNNYYNDGENNHKQKIQLRWDLITAILILLGFQNNEQKTKDSPLIMTIKRGILAKQRKQYHQAEMLLHTALKMAQDLSYTDAETYIFDIIGDNYFEKGDYKRAIELYLEVLSRISKHNDFTNDCEALIELSIKLSYCYSRTEQIDNAEKGFQYSIDTQLLRVDLFYDDKNNKLRNDNDNNNIDDNDEQKNSLALLGMAYDFYSKHLESLSTKLLERSLIYRQKALNISKIINNNNNNRQTIILENDIADLYVRMKKFDHAKQYLKNAIDKSIELKFDDLLPILYINLATIYHQNNRNDLSKKYCQKAMDLIVIEKNNKEFIKQNDDEQLTNMEPNILTEKERLKLMEKCDLCLNGLIFY